MKDGKWGGEVNGKWNGLVAELINHETDLVMTSLKINSGNISMSSRIRSKIWPFILTKFTNIFFRS